MTYEIRISIGIGLTLAAITFVVFRFPALTSGGTSAVAQISEAEFQRVAGEERDHCEANLDGVNCRCFGAVSAVILADQTPRVPNAFYANKEELARGQAQSKC